MSDPSNPLIVQSDRTVLLEVASPKAGDARIELARFAELERAPEHIHTYRLTPLSLWNAAAAGVTPDGVVEVLQRFAKYPVPQAVLVGVAEDMARFGRLELVADDDTGDLALVADTVALLELVASERTVAGLLGQRLDGNRFAVPLASRGPLKQALLALGWPPEDRAGYVEGVGLDLALRCLLRPYQQEAVEVWWSRGSTAGGSGVLVLPCGAGKTIIGMAAMAHAAARTLILVTSITAARQWKRELLDKTTLTAAQVGEYSGQRKQLREVTIATYQVLTWRDRRGSAAGGEEFPHLEVVDGHPWGLVVYDEVHLLPAPVFRVTATIQAVRRLGMTATLVREDGKEGDVFSLIGPKRYDAPWRALEAQGWIAPATCVEVRVNADLDEQMAYAVAPAAQRYRVAATVAAKNSVVDELVQRHTAAGDRVLVIGQYLDQLRALADRLGAPVITGQTSQRVRAERFAAFLAEEPSVLVVSKIANFSIDLPEANVAVQVSGAFGSRQEEAQRLGRLLRPKADGGQATFYTVVTRDTVDVEFAARRQRFLTEQGYDYRITDADDVQGSIT
ncbi:MAG: DNA repair helicase XPB [Euzebya sp.]